MLAGCASLQLLLRLLLLSPRGWGPHLLSPGVPGACPRTHRAHAHVRLRPPPGALPAQEAVTVRKKEVAVWLREGLVRLGPTFIKIGQQFSTRVDVLSPEFVKELEVLQVRLLLLLLWWPVHACRVYQRVLCCPAAGGGCPAMCTRHEG